MPRSSGKTSQKRAADRRQVTAMWRQLVMCQSQRRWIQRVEDDTSPDSGPTPAASPEPSTSQMMAEFLEEYGSSDSSSEEEDLGNIFRYQRK